MAKKINNERVYSDYDVIQYTANTNREYYVTDTAQLEKDGGVVKQEVHQYSDLYPIPSTDKIITTDDIIEMEKRAYRRAVRMLKAQRPEEVFQFDTTALPNDLFVGDKVRFIYTKTLTEVDECGNKKETDILNVDDYFYVTGVTMSFDDALNEVDTVTLDKELRTNDFDEPELELPDKPNEGRSRKGSEASTGGSISAEFDSSPVRTAY